MNRYTVSAEIVVASSPERAYAVASSVDAIPVYENGILRIQVIEENGANERVGRSTLKILGLETPFTYRYRYSPGRHYSGVQEQGSVVRGFFSFSFTSVRGGTRIVHREGMFSRAPFAASVVGWLYYQLIARAGLNAELRKLKALIEAPHSHSQGDK
ncbi:MAG TPA: SRPBCC family protein [Longimicrobiales bacterium]|nr:SRPBCC family protein [Longimicrobiales bacterium]